MRPKSCTETSITKYQSALSKIPEERIYKDMCPAVRHLNEKYVEDPKKLSQRGDAAFAMVGK
jgi:hypothetical protein